MRVPRYAPENGKIGLAEPENATDLDWVEVLKLRTSAFMPKTEHYKYIYINLVIYQDPREGEVR